MTRQITPRNFAKCLKELSPNCRMTTGDPFCCPLARCFGWKNVFAKGPHRKWIFPFMTAIDELGDNKKTNKVSSKECLKVLTNIGLL